MNLFELDLVIQLMYERQLEEIILIHIQQGLPADMIPRHIRNKMNRNRVLEWADNDNARGLVKQQLIDCLTDNTLAADRVVN